MDPTPSKPREFEDSFVVIDSNGDDVEDEKEEDKNGCHATASLETNALEFNFKLSSQCDEESLSPKLKTSLPIFPPKSEEEVNFDTPSGKTLSVENDLHRLHRPDQVESIQPLDESDEPDGQSDDMNTRTKRDKYIQEGPCYERDVGEKDKEHNKIVQEIEGENGKQDEALCKLLDGTSSTNCSPKGENKSSLKALENRECATKTLVDSQHLQTEMTKSKEMQFYIREDELSPQKGLINEVEGNQHVIVKSGGQLSNLTTSSSTQEFETPDEKANQEIESSERDSSYETTVKESILMISVENVEDHKSAENLNDGMNQRRIKNDERDETTSRQKLCQASLETTGTKNNQKNVALKQHEITDELQNTKETHKIHEEDSMDHTPSKLSEFEDSFVVIDSNVDEEEDEKEEDKSSCHATASLELNASEFHFKLNRQNDEESFSPKLKTGLPIFPPNIEEEFNVDTPSGKTLSIEYEFVTENVLIGNDNNDLHRLHRPDQVESIQPLGLTYGKDMNSKEMLPRSENETQLLNSEVNKYLNVNLDGESRKEMQEVYHHNGLSKDSDKGSFISSAFSVQVQDEPVKNKHQRGNENYTEEHSTSEQCEQANEDDIGNIDINNENDSDKHVVETTYFHKVSLLNEEHAYNEIHNMTQRKVKSTSDESDEPDGQSDEMNTRTKRDKHIQEGPFYERDVGEKDKEHRKIIQEIEGENGKQDGALCKLLDGTSSSNCSPKGVNKSSLKALENRECATKTLVDSQHLQTGMTKSKKMQFYIREDELSPQKGLINEVEGNQHVIVKSGGQLSNLTTSSPTQEFETPDEKAKQEIESSERDSSYETTVKESILMISVENVEGHKSAENLDDGMNQRRIKNVDRDETTTGQELCQASLETTGTKINQKSVALKQHEITDELQNTKETHKIHEADDDIDHRRTKNGESEDTNAPREKLFQASLETTDTKANQRSVAIKQKEIADGLQNNTEIDKIPVVIKTKHGEVRLIKVGKFHLISINGKKSKLPRSISQDTDLRLEKIGNDILLFTETICYRVRIEQDNIVLEDMSIKSLPLKPSSESHDTKENTANELKIDNENERDTKVGSIESEHKSNDVQHNINEQCIFEINQKDTSESRGETTQIESSSTQEQVEKTMKLQEDVKDITLIKVGKFWLISVNGRKSKLPKTINQDPTLKIEVDGVDLLLLSDSCCYKIRQNENKITLDEYNSYFQREPNDNISCCAKTRIITDQCGVHPDRYFDNYNQEHKCKESSDLELKEQTEVIRKGPYDIETEENASTNNAGASLPLDDRRHIGTNLETINGSLKNGENENQNEPCMTGVSEIARDARQDKYCPLLPDVESKETGSQDGMEDLIHQLESMNLKDKSGHTSPTVSATIEDQGSKEQIKFTDKGYKSTCTSLEAKGMQLQERSPPVVQIEGIEDENKLRLGKHVTKSIELPAHIPWSKLISKFNIASMIKESVDNVIVDMEMIGPFTSLKVVGLKKEIEAVEKYIKSEIIEKVCHEEIVISFKNMAVFKQPSFYDFLDKQLGGGTSLLLENNKLFAYSLNRDNLMKATRKVCTLVQETSVPLTGKWRSEDALKHLLGITVNNPCNVFTMVNSNKTCIIITGLKEHVERISEEIEELQKSGGIKKNYKLPEQVSSTKVNYEKKTYLQPSDVWQRLAHKFNIKATLESAVESVKVEFRKETTKMGHVCALVITGKKDDTELVSKHFEQHYKEKLFIKDLQLHVKRMDVFRKTDICDVLERKFADVIVLFQHDRLTVFSFDTIVGKRTADAVHKELKEERISVQGRFNKEDMAQLVDELKRNREGVYYIIDTVDSSLYVAGCKETVTKVINELSQKIKRDSASTIRAEIENMEAFEVLKLDENFLNDLKHRFGIEINIQNNQRCFEIKGEHTDVIFCEREIQQYCMDVISEQTEDLFEESDHVVSNAFQTRLDTVAEQNDVIIQRSLTNKSRHGPSFTDEMTDRKSFLFPNEHKLILPDQPEDDNCSDFIVHITEVSDNFGSTTRMVHHRKFVEMKVPYFKTDDAVIDITKNIIQPLLQEAERDNESVVEFKLPLMKTWSIDDMAYCWYSAIHEYFMNVDKNTNPKYVIICQPKEISYHYFVDCCKLQARKVTDAYGAVKHKRQPRFKITVESGKLNEIKADVLVNTVSANLDLKMGAVSSALLTTAGPLLQTEITKLYPHNLRPGDIAITGGYNLKCDKVFHGALNVYDEKNLLNITKQFRGFLKTCLFKASEYRATSIAFPAIGTGNLRYPVEFVVREMYDVVSEFEQKGYDTTLKDVLFVVFPGDFIAVDVFKKREAQENSILYTEREDGGSQHQQPKMCLKINVIGHKDKVRKARQTIDEMMLGKNKVIPVNLPTYADALKMPTVKTDLTSHLKPAMGIVETLSEPSDIRRAFRCCTVEGLTVRVYRRNILNLPVDCIVNAANKQLGHHSGIALAIANAAGNDFIRESKKIVQQYGELATGNATRTNPGQLSYKCVIHAVGPNWHDYSPYTAENVLKCQEDLKKAIISSLEIAEKFRMSTIAIPAVSSASFGVPKELCAMQYVKAVQTFSAQRPKHARSLAEVHFVDLDAEMIRLIKEAFSEMLINRQPCPWSWRIYVEKSTADAAKRHQAKLQNTDDHYQKRCPYYIDDGQILTCNYTPTRIVSVSKGDIFNLKDFDVIVCSEDESGSAAGGVAKLLLTKCGYQYEQEKKSLYKQKHPKTGEVHITHGGTSRYRFIMHAIMPHRLNCKSEGQWIKALEDMMNTIFYTAEKHRYKSMAMSLLGTGAGKSDPKRCAEILFDCFTLSCTRYKDSLFYLRVVNTDMGRNRIVTNVFKEHMTQPKY